ncbi:MAG: hypothetical protein LBV42_01635 [Methanobrevibacter sp.]|jgi:hypothetical protein|nr:hypothetical protein [Methanobrevibacter sp.]
MHDQVARIVDNRPNYFHIDDLRSRRPITESSINFNYKDHEMYLSTGHALKGPTAMLIKGLHPC